MDSSKPATIIAATALVVAVLFATPLGQAASGLIVPKNSVGAAQLKRSAVTGLKVKDGSLSAADFRAGQLPKGAPGPKGPKGDPGAQGPKGDPGATKVTKRTGPAGPDASPGNSSGAYASCQSGETLVGGGASYTAQGLGKATLTASAPNDNGQWAVAVRNDSGTGLVQAYAYALCAAP